MRREGIQGCICTSRCYSAFLKVRISLKTSARMFKFMCRAKKETGNPIGFCAQIEGLSKIHLAGYIQTVPDQKLVTGYQHTINELGNKEFYPDRNHLGGR